MNVGLLLLFLPLSVANQKASPSHRSSLPISPLIESLMEGTVQGDSHQLCDLRLLFS